MVQSDVQSGAHRVTAIKTDGITNERMGEVRWVEDECDLARDELFAKVIA